jgi:flagellar biosynthesis protein FliQ
MADILIELLRTLFIVGLPVVLFLALAGTVAAALQSATTVVEPALGYAARLVALVIVGYLFLPTFIEAVSALALRAWQ